MPAELRRAEPTAPSEMVRRAGWLSLTERRAVLAHRVVDFAMRWDGGEGWHTGAAVSVRPASCATARQWAERLVPADREQAPTVLEHQLLDNARDAETDVLMRAPVTGVPAFRRCAARRKPRTKTSSPSHCSVCPPRRRSRP
ncbi:hypothetical protein [Streptomyces sp. NPDC053542]|uniref:hypothetical protein n=1 Tax=Streptomyces sp. NPDC053542 TaxID=3365710 RepID=UPI0037D6BA5C